MGEWFEGKLADVCASIDYGLTASACDQPVGPKFLRITDIVSSALNWKQVPFVPANDTDTQKFKLHSGDIVIARTGATTGESRFIIDPPKAVFASYLVRLKVNRENNPRFISYWLKSPAFRNYLEGVLGDKSAQPNASASTMTRASIRIPACLEEQNNIASILGALDDKIELNRRMNETLEAMARAIFKDWFVDFGPTRAKAEGRAPYLAPELWDLFPDALDDEGKPVGWQIQALRDLVSVTRGRSYRSIDLRDSNVALVTLKSFKRGGGYRRDGLKPYTGRYKAEQVIREGELVVAMTDVTQSADVIGKPAIVLADERFDTLVASLDVSIVRIQDGRVGQAFVSQLLRTEQFQSHAYSHSTGTTVLHLSKDALPIFRVCIPPSQLAAKFEEIVGPITSRDAFNAYESQSLAQTRDLLLPKLMSGEVCLRDAERLVEEAT